MIALLSIVLLFGFNLSVIRSADTNHEELQVKMVFDTAFELETIKKWAKANMSYWKACIEDLYNVEKDTTKGIIEVFELGKTDSYINMMRNHIAMLNHTAKFMKGRILPFSDKFNIEVNCYELGVFKKKDLDALFDEIFSEFSKLLSKESLKFIDDYNYMHLLMDYNKKDEEIEFNKLTK